MPMIPICTISPLRSATIKWSALMYRDNRHRHLYSTELRWKTILGMPKPFGKHWPRFGVT